MGPVAGADRKRMHELRLDLAGLARFPSKGLPRPGSRTEVNYARSTQPYVPRAPIIIPIRTTARACDEAAN
jgi:hypothetical protein